MTRSPAFGFLDKAHFALMASQIALIFGWIVSRGFDDLPTGFTTLVVCTAMAQVGVHRLARARLPPGSLGWIVASRFAVLAVFTAATIIIALARFEVVGVPAEAPQLIVGLFWLVITMKGAAVGKIPPNRAIGLCVHWTTHSRLAWDRAHRTLGRILFWGGLAGIAMSLLISFLASLVLIGALIATAVTFALVEAQRAYRADPERRPS